jgi:hydrogenase nickel incorporation protein HypA/HybF
MHELSITQDIIDIVGEAARSERVVRVVLEVGKLAGVVPEAIGFCFDVASRGTPVEGAALSIVLVEGADLRIKTVEVEVTPCA